MVGKQRKLLIGAHTSAAGGAHNALYQGQEIGATCIQLFTSNQKQWRGRPITDELIEKWNKALDETGITHVMSHNSYLTNLGSPREEVLEKSRKAFREEIERCLALKLTFMNFHPGAALTSSVEECLNLIVESLLLYQDCFDGSHDLTLLLESTAGQGSVVGWDFAELGFIIDEVKGRVPLGVCIDTCHSFSAGYDIRDKKGWDKTLKEFDDEVGLEHLKALHVNDSLKELGSRKDRHAHLGEGEIGMECFKVMMQHPKLKEIPKYLETPGGVPYWTKEIELLRKFAK